MTTETLWGWGMQRRVPCDVRTPDVADQVARELSGEGTIARGLGRSYGDAALNEHRRVLRTTALDRYLSFDADSGLLTAEAGVSLDQIIRDFAPRGFFPAITPGTKMVTLGGCIANDVHGKAHHAQGTFVTCTESLRMLLADGRTVTASRSQNPDLFWATFGGMGLTGVVLDATIRLRKIETTYFRQKAYVARDLDELLAKMEEANAEFPYSVTTIDPMARGAKLGRGTVSAGDHARLDELPAKLRRDPLHVNPPALIKVPFELPEATLNPVTMRLGGVAMQTILRAAPQYSHADSFFYPLDMFREWNRGYGHRGFIQYQFVIPFSAGASTLRTLLETIMESDQLPFLNILKRFGPANQAPLSFPTSGFTFAIDFPVRDGLKALTERLDGMVADAGGRIYLGKDSFLSAENLRRMYGSKVDDFLEVKAKWDPQGLFTSDLGRRVGLSK